MADEKDKDYKGYLKATKKKAKATKKKYKKVQRKSGTKVKTAKAHSLKSKVLKLFGYKSKSSTKNPVKQGQKPTDKGKVTAGTSRTVTYTKDKKSKPGKSKNNKSNKYKVMA